MELPVGQERKSQAGRVLFEMRPVLQVGSTCTECHYSSLSHVTPGYKAQPRARRVVSKVGYNRSPSRTTASRYWKELRSSIDGESCGNALSSSRSLVWISG